MRQLLSLLIALALLIALPLSAAAAAPEEDGESAASPAEETEEALPDPGEPEETPLPTPGWLPNLRVVPAEKDELSRLLEDSGVDYAVDLAAYYLEQMRAAAEQGDVKAGQIAGENRDNALAAGGLGEPIAFDDLYLLARLIAFEAGSDWLTDEYRMCTGEVVLNRVDSPEFPDSIHDVVYQKGQYSVVNSPRFASMKPPAVCVDAALRLLQGERHMVPGVVFQADYIQGELFSVYTDRRLGNTYFCLSDNLDLYP